METKKTIDFKNFKLHTNAAQSHSVVADVREQVADMLITSRLCGIAAHMLVHKIYESEEPVVLTEWESNTLAKVAAEYGSVPFIDSLFPLLGLKFEDFASQQNEEFIQG